MSDTLFGRKAGRESAWWRQLAGTPSVGWMDELTPNEEVDLLRRMAGGDTAALGAFYDLHSGRLFALACRILGDAGEAEDVLQETFMQIWQKASAFNPAQGKPISWAITLTRNRAIDRLRSAQRRRARLVEDSAEESLQEEPATAEPSPETARFHEQGGRIRAALARLPAPQRRAIELAFFDGLTQSEVAATTREPLGTVKARIRRGMLKLREELERFL
jgi:RNA polymerase sigma-70 factor (ECF subfamily)